MDHVFHACLLSFQNLLPSHKFECMVSISLDHCLLPAEDFLCFRYLNFLTCLLRTQWNMKMTSPWRELKMANMYLKAMVFELKLKSPNSHVIPSKGKITAEALTPAFTLPIWVLSCIYLVPIIWWITKTNIPVLIWIQNNWSYCSISALFIWCTRLADPYQEITGGGSLIKNRGFLRLGPPGSSPGIRTKMMDNRQSTWPSTSNGVILTSKPEVRCNEDLIQQLFVRLGRKYDWVSFSFTWRTLI